MPQGNQAGLRPAEEVPYRGLRKLLTAQVILRLTPRVPAQFSARPGLAIADVVDGTLHITTAAG